MAAYLTLPEAIDRLNAYGIDSDAISLVTAADLRAASDALDSLAPFYGERPEDQERQFPRVDETEVPEAVLDWVALRAMCTAADEEPAIISESAGRTSVTYAYPKTPQTYKRMHGLLRPYLRRSANFV